MIADLTHEELVAVARFWFRRLDQIDWDALRGGPLEDVSPKEIAVANSRLRRVAGLVGEEAVRKARKDVREENHRFEMLGQHLDDEEKYIQHKKQDKEIPQQVFEYLRENPYGYQFDDSGDLWSFRTDGKLLVLTVTTFGGSRTSFPTYTIPVPWGWVAPFGLH